MSRHLLLRVGLVVLNGAKETDEVLVRRVVVLDERVKAAGEVCAGLRRVVVA